jgi:hypothetical protein
MESMPVDNLPNGKGWQFEPKWDGFRCIAFRDGDAVHLQSRNQKPLGRYFPELEEAVRALPIRRFVLDGEIIIREEPFATGPSEPKPEGWQFGREKPWWLRSQLAGASALTHEWILRAATWGQITANGIRPNDGSPLLEWAASRLGRLRLQGRLCQLTIGMCSNGKLNR